MFEAAAQLGAILGGAAPEVELALTAYGMHLGTAFQLIDDVLDYSGQEVETGKHLGDDLAEGKPTLPLIYVMQHGTPEQAACVRKAIEQGVLESIGEQKTVGQAGQQVVRGQISRAFLLDLGAV